MYFDHTIDNNNVSNREKGELFKLQGDNLNLPPTHEEKHFDSTISASTAYEPSL